MAGIIKTPANPINADLSVHPATVAVNYTGTTTALADGCRGIIVNADGAYKLYFNDDKTTAITMTLIAGIVYPFSIVKATTTGDAALGANVLHMLY